MKNYLFILFSFLFLLSSCEGEKKKEVTPKKVESLIEVKDGIYTEYYPGRKAVKIQGPQLKNGNRNGVWFFYSENGNKQSMTEFADGKANGLTFVNYPNGAIRYTGEYTDGKTTGLWKFYDEKGHLSQCIDHDSINALKPTI
jgi:antitoxin component YwqK of YwqJK toxin-antitoxin module